jgi:hypothetical protein
MGLLHGRAGRVTAKNAGFRPGQTGVLATAAGALLAAGLAMVRHNRNGGPEWCRIGAASVGSERSLRRRAPASAGGDARRRPRAGRRC